MSQISSSFHLELLNILSHNVSLQMLEGGFDELSDPELKAFRENLKLALDENSGVSWLEIVGNYNYLFHERGPVNLEKKLFAAFSSKTHSIPMYRGLPRRYKREQPAISQLHKNFIHLPTLKRLASEKMIFKIYDGMEHPGMAVITVFTWVIQDGWGDLAASIDTVEILKRRFPDLQINSVVLFPQKMGTPPMPKGADEKRVVYYDEVESISLGEEILKMLRHSDLILQTPTFYPFFENLREKTEALSYSSKLPSWSSIGEYGFIESQWHHPQSGNRSLGLHFLEKGVFIKSVLKDENFSDLQNAEILAWLFGSHSPGLEEIGYYKREFHFHFAYLASPVGGAVYLNALQKMYENDSKGIDICSPDIHWLIGYAQMQAEKGSPILEGVSVELYYGQSMAVLTEGEKKMRIFCPKTISPQDFHLLIHLSDGWVAVRGNQSFSEALSTEKPFFFDVREHSRNFFKDVLALAENRIQAYESTIEVLKETGKIFLQKGGLGDAGQWVDETYFQMNSEPWKEIAEKIGAALQNKNCSRGFQVFSQIIKKEHSFNEFLSHFVQRELCHRAYPFAKIVEEEAMAPFLMGRSSIDAASSELKKKLAYGR
ncbi:MAG TPA: hypothetical protein VLE95_04000 [Chlamydiales bacterium]|nr:hypothetical protein [Chlamydiales bacterium]